MSGAAKILVVDDEPEVAAVLWEYFNGRGFEVVKAGGGVEGLALLEKTKPDVVFLDVRMPELDGMEVLRRIREVNPWVGVFMMSGNEDSGLAQEVLKLGAFDYVLKPFDFDYLDRAVRKLLSLGAQTTTGDEARPAVPEPSPHGLLYDLALEIFRATRTLPPAAQLSLGTSLENAALGAVQRGISGEKAEVIRALNHVRMLIRFGRDLGDFSDDLHRHLESYVVRARRSVGLS